MRTRPLHPTTARIALWPFFVFKDGKKNNRPSTLPKIDARLACQWLSFTPSSHASMLAGPCAGENQTQPEWWGRGVLKEDEERWSFGPSGSPPRGIQQHRLPCMLQV